MEIFKATIVASNSCYIETVLVIADDKDKAHEILCAKKKRKVDYKSKLEPLTIDLMTPSVIEMVGWGENDSDYSNSDD